MLTPAHGRHAEGQRTGVTTLEEVVKRTAAEEEACNQLRALLEEMIEKDASTSTSWRASVQDPRGRRHRGTHRAKRFMDAKGHPVRSRTRPHENQKKRFETENELDFRSASRIWPLRGNVFKQRGCVSVVIRKIPFNK